MSLGWRVPKADPWRFFSLMALWRASGSVGLVVPLVRATIGKSDMGWGGEAGLRLDCWLGEWMARMYQIQ